MTTNDRRADDDADRRSIAVLAATAARWSTPARASRQRCPSDRPSLQLRWATALLLIMTVCSSLLFGLSSGYITDHRRSISWLLPGGVLLGGLGSKPQSGWSTRIP